MSEGLLRRGGTPVQITVFKELQSPHSSKWDPLGHAEDRSDKQPESNRPAADRKATDVCKGCSVHASAVTWPKGWEEGGRWPWGLEGGGFKKETSR